MKKRWIIPFVIAAGLAFLAVAWYYSFTHEEFLRLLIDTDKQTYQVGETIHVRIENFDERTIDIYCPMNCALGNFPTSVERYLDGEWSYFAGFCPSIEPLFGNYPQEGNYIIHSLAPGETYALELTNLESLNIQGEVRLRIMYSIYSGKGTIYSPDFTVKP
jgi:hypothetical protein